MSNVLFDRSTLNVSGVGRNPLSHEVEILDVDTTGLSKTVNYTELEDKITTITNTDGTTSEKKVFDLPQDPVLVDVAKEIQVETTYNTGNPIMETVIDKDPVLDSNGNIVKYEVTTLGETTTVTDDPVMITIENADGTTSEEQKTDENGNLLYWGQVGTGQWLTCYTTEEKEVQKKDSAGQPLFWDSDTEVVQEWQDQAPLEIIEDSTEYNALTDEELGKLIPQQVEVAKSRTAKFSEEKGVFTYDELIAHKEKQLVNDTFYSSAKLIEKMDKALFSTDLTSFNADLGFDLVSIPSGGQVRTEKITLPVSSDLVGVKFESHIDGLTVSVGNLASDIQPLDSFGERKFSSVVSDVYVLFENNTSKRIDLTSFALLV